ncbi:hypothetical protein G159_10130 [Planococcus glaciei CHR43]|nr:hypothetical protein G159_10130 [Planococcus glaciei CHR43]
MLSGLEIAWLCGLGKYFEGKFMSIEIASVGRFPRAKR